MARVMPRGGSVLLTPTTHLLSRRDQLPRGVGSFGADRGQAARPAFNLNTGSFLFISAAEGGKAGTFMGETLHDVGDYTGRERKLTLKDSSRSNFSADVNGDAITLASAGSTVEINYSGAKEGDNEYVSAMLVDSDNTVLYYGRIAQNSVHGTAKMKIPDELAVGSYDQSAARLITEAQTLIVQLTEYRQALAARYAALATAAYRDRRELTRRRAWRNEPVYYNVRIVRTYEDGITETMLSETYPGKQRPGIETLKDIAPKSWEK